MISFTARDDSHSTKRVLISDDARDLQCAPANSHSAPSRTCLLSKSRSGLVLLGLGSAATASTSDVAPSVAAPLAFQYACSHVSSTISPENALRGKHLIVADMDWPPFFIVDNTKIGNERYSGLDVRIPQDCTYKTRVQGSRKGH